MTRACEQRHPIDRRAQALELRNRWDRAFGLRVGHPPPPFEPYGLVPGSLCLEKEGLGRFDHAPLLVVWRPMDPKDWQDRLIVRHWIETMGTVDRIDVFVGMLDDDDAHTVSVAPHALHLLRAYEPGKDD